MKEEDLYKPVADFIRREFDCFVVGVKKGISLGTIDVVGIRYVMGDFGGEAEVIGVEVKPEGATFLKAIGQALGYSVMTDRCYLAVQKKYGRHASQTEKDVAAQLGVGLIEVGKQRNCRVVVSSPRQQPMRAHKLSLVNKLGYVECVVCGCLFEPKSVRSSRDRSNITDAVREKKPFRYWLMALAEQRGDARRKYVYDRRHICMDCIAALGGFSKQN